jgi:multidrug efflux system outer membrane protein
MHVTTDALNIATYAGGIATVMLLAGCQVGPDYERPATTDSASWREATAPMAAASQLDTNWWTLFNDPVLNRLQRGALTDNQDLRLAVARVDESRASLGFSKADRYPAVDLSSTAERYRRSANGRILNTNSTSSGLNQDTFTFALDASYEVDLWGRVRRSIESADAQLAAEAAARDTVLLTLTADVAQNYFNLRQLDAELDVLQRTIGLRSNILQVTRARHEGGIGAEVDVVSAETELADAESEAIEVQRRRALVEHALAVLCGKTPADFHLDPQPETLSLPPVIAAGLPAELLTRRPDVARAERLAAAQCASVGVAKAAFLPTITLTGAAGFESLELSDLFTWESRAWSFGPKVTMPIFQGGRNRANLQMTEARYEQTVAEYRQSVLVAFREVEDALVNLRRRAERASVLLRAQDAARQTADAYERGMRGGVYNFLNIVDSQRTMLRAETAVVQNTGERYAATVQLVKALGGGWSSPEAGGQPMGDDVEE